MVLYSECELVYKCMAVNQTPCKKPMTGFCKARIFCYKSEQTSSTKETIDQEKSANLNIHVMKLLQITLKNKHHQFQKAGQLRSNKGAHIWAKGRSIYDLKKTIIETSSNL